MISGRGCLPAVSRCPHRLSDHLARGTNLLRRCPGRRSRYTRGQSYSRRAARAACLSSAAGRPRKANRETPSGTRASRLNQVSVEPKSEHGAQRRGEATRGNAPRTRTFFSGNRFPLATEPSIDVQRFFCSPLRSSPAEVEV